MEGPGATEENSEERVTQGELGVDWVIPEVQEDMLGWVVLREKVAPVVGLEAEMVAAVTTAGQAEPMEVASKEGRKGAQGGLQTQGAIWIPYESHYHA